VSGETVTCRLRDAKIRGLVTSEEVKKYLKKGVKLNEYVTVQAKSSQPAGKPRKIKSGGES
jgi:hypothetical protein